MSPLAELTEPTDTQVLIIGNCVFSNKRFYQCLPEIKVENMTAGSRDVNELRHIVETWKLVFVETKLRSVFREGGFRPQVGHCPDGIASCSGDMNRASRIFIECGGQFIVLAR